MQPKGVIAYKNGVVTAFHAINYYTYDAPVEIELHCENGLAKMVADKATVTLNDELLLRIITRLKQSLMTQGEGYWGVSHVKQINNYYDVLQGKVDALDIPAEEALKTQQMINAIYQSGKEKQRVHF